MLLLLGLPFLMGSLAGRWEEVARLDLGFARALAERGVAFGPDFVNEIIDGRLAGCTPRPSRIAGLEPAESRLVALYGRLYCDPWYDAWAHALRRCDGVLFVPDWCEWGHEAELAEKFRFDRYVEVFVAAMGRVEDPLHRRNIMAVLLDRLGSKALRDYPPRALAPAVAEVVRRYLEEAGPEEAMSLGWALLRTPHRANPEVADALTAYAEGESSLTEEQRRIVTSLVDVLRGGKLPDRDRDALIARFGPKPDKPPPPLPDIDIDEEKIRALLDRVQTWHRFVKAKDYDSTWEMLSTDARETASRRAYMATMKDIYGGMHDLSWEVTEMRSHANRVKVVVKLSYSVRKLLFWKEERSFLSNGFWVYEKGTWFDMRHWPYDWLDKDSTPISVPPNTGADATP